MGLGDRIERLEPGYEADVAILDADPLGDVGVAASQVFGVLDGVLRTPADLTVLATDRAGS